MIKIENKIFCVIYLTCSKTEPNIRSASHRNSTICHSSARPPKDDTDNFSRKTYRRSFESLEDHDRYGLCKSTFDHIQAQQNERAHDANPTGSAPEGMSNASALFSAKTTGKTTAIYRAPSRKPNVDGTYNVNGKAMSLQELKYIFDARPSESTSKFSPTNCTEFLGDSLTTSYRPSSTVTQS